MGFKMNKALIIIMLSFYCQGQSEKPQTIGTATNYLITCPCKLFKYYEKGKLFYFCKDKKTNIEYLIKEFKHKDGIDIILNTIEKNINKKDKAQLDRSVKNEQMHALNNYLHNNPKGKFIDFMNAKAIIVKNRTENKLFFTDKDFITSHELIMSGQDSTKLYNLFIQTIESLILKHKKIF